MVTHSAVFVIKFNTSESDIQFKQFFGECNKLDWAMRECTKNERLQKVSDNLEASKKRNADIQKKMGGLKSSDWRTNLQEKLDSENSQS